MKPNNEKGGKKSMYKQSKRFLAGFLAFLLVVTMIPTDLLGVVYAAEETDAIESEAFDSVADVEEAEVLENAEADDDADAEEVLDENDIVKDGESTGASDPEKPEGGDSSVAPTPSQPSEPASSTQEPSEPASTPVSDPQPSEPTSEPVSDPQPSEPTSEPASTPEPSEPASTPTEEVNNWELDMKDAVYEAGKPLKKKIGNSTIDTIFTATAGFTLDKGDINTTDGKTFTYRLKTGGKSSHTNRCIEFTPTKPGKLIVYAVPSSAATNRALRLDVDNDENGQSIIALSPAVRMEFDVTQVGKVHHLGSTNSGINIGYISMEYTAESVSLNDATLSVKVTDQDGKEVTSPKYTGDAYSIKTTVTDKNGKLVNNSRYKVTYERKGTDDNWSATEDLTSAGTIRVKVENAEGNNLTGSTYKDIVIAKADLEAADKTINHSPDETGNKEYDIAGLFAEAAGADTLSYSVAVTTAGTVIENPQITAEKKLTYDIKTASGTDTSTVLTVTVTSDNYNDKTFTITVNRKEKVSVSITLKSQECVYDGATHGFDDTVEILTVTGNGITEANKEEAIKDLKDNLSYKYQAEGGEAVSEEPVDAGTYTIIAELASASAYTLSDSATSATLTINPKPVKIKAKDATWDKVLDAQPTSKPAEAKDYEFIAVTEGETGFGLVSGDTMATQPTIKYYKKDTENEMAADDWSALVNDDTVDIVLSDADAGKNYDISYEKGTLTTIARTANTTMTVVPDTGATLAASALTPGNNTVEYAVDTLVADNLFLITADESNKVTAEYRSKGNRLKLGGVGSQFVRSIGFKTSKAANLSISVETASGSGEIRELVVARLNEDNTVTVCGGDSQVGAKKDVSVTLAEAGTYYIYGKGALNFYEVAVSYDNVVIPETVSVTPTISTEDQAKLGDAKVYFTLIDEADKEVKSGEALTLTKGKTYTLAVKNGTTVVDTLKATIDGVPAYLADNNAEITIDITADGEEPAKKTAILKLMNGDAVYKEIEVEIEDGPKPKPSRFDLSTLDTSDLTPPAGKKFVGWGSTATATELVGTRVIVPAKGRTLYAIFADENAKIFTVTFEDESGEELYTSTVIENGTVVFDGGYSEKEGYTFAGWKLKGSDTDKVYLPEETYTVTGDVTFVETWKAAVYTVRLVTETDTEISKTEVEAGKEFTFPDTKNTKEGYFFAGWMSDNNGSVYSAGQTYEVWGDDTFRETWELPSKNDLTVKFMDEYESTEFTELAKTIEAGKNPTITLPEPVSKKIGYVFTGWYDNVNWNYYKPGESYTVKENVVFHESWDYEYHDNGMYIRLDGETYYQGGAAVTPDVTVIYNENYLTLGTDYTVKYKNNKNVSTAAKPATLTVIGIGNYKGIKKDASFSILPRNIRDNDDISIPGHMTLIKDAKVAPVITYKGKPLKLGKDFTLKEGTNIDPKGKYTGTTTAPAGTNEDGSKKEAEIRTMTVTGINNFSGTREIAIKVVDKESAKQLTIQVDNNFKPVVGDGTDYDYLFSGTPKKDAQGNIQRDENGIIYDTATKKIKVLDKKTKAELTQNKDFEVVYTDNTTFMAGTVKFMVVGIGEYSGNVSKSFKIAPKKLEDSNIIAGVFDHWDYEKNAPVMKEKPEATYNNSKAGATPYIRVYYKYTVKDSNGADKAYYQQLSDYDPIDYKVTYSANKKVGKAKAKITFLGDYKGTKAKTVEFDVVGDILSDLKACAADMVYSKPGKSYVSKPIVEYEGTILKASEYTASYEWSSASDVTVNETTKAETRNWTKDDKVQIELKDGDKYATVRVTITPNAKKSNFKLATITETVDGKETTVDKPLIVYYNVTKADGALDLSKAKVEFYSKVTYDKKTKTATYNDADKLKSVQFCDGDIWTPSVDEYEDEWVKKDNGAVYVKVTVNKTTVVDPGLYTVDWICNYNAGKATVVISGNEPATTAPTNPADGGTASATTYAAGSKTVTVKVDPIKSWIEPKVAKAINDLFKKIF